MPDEPKQPYLTASSLYDYLQCPHRVWRDRYGPQAEKLKETNPFVQLLWEKGVQHEKKAVSRLGGMVDLRAGGQEARILRTQKALGNKIPLLYQPVICHRNLLGIPDFLRLMDDGSYIAMDVKSGRGFEGTDEGESETEPKQKKHYAVQLALYTEILENIGYSNGKREGIIYDIDHREIPYNLMAPIGIRNKTTFWEYYVEVKSEAYGLVTNRIKNDPAMAGVCKLCPWYISCQRWLVANDDVSRLFYIGRSVRTTLRADLNLTTVEEAQNIQVRDLLAEKTDKDFLKGIGPKTLEKIKVRATMMANKKPPILHQKLEFPKVDYELFFDIEDDPTQAFVYLHGVYERSPKSKRFISFVADSVTSESEARAWRQFWEYIKALPKDGFAIYYYSHHERTMYKRMAEQYPEVATLEDVEWLFSKQRAIDLYTDMVLKHTDWPVSSYSLKTIAQYLKFNWRDKSPSGALSIQWYNEYLKTGDPKTLERIVLYNEDDCVATMVIKDALVEMDKSL